MARLNWDRATAQDRVRESGGEPAWLGLPMPVSLRLTPKAAKAAKARKRRVARRPLRSPAVRARSAAETMCRSVDAVVAEFSALSAWEQAATLTACQARIRRICTDERRMPDDTAHSREVLRDARQQMERRLAAVAGPDGSARTP